MKSWQQSVNQQHQLTSLLRLVWFWNGVTLPLIRVDYITMTSWRPIIPSQLLQSLAGHLRGKRWTLPCIATTKIKPTSSDIVEVFEVFFIVHQTGLKMCRTLTWHEANRTEQQRVTGTVSNWAPVPHSTLNLSSRQFQLLFYISSTSVLHQFHGPGPDRGWRPPSSVTVHHRWRWPQVDSERRL